MKLVVAEKPSVAKEIASVLGATKRESGFYTGNGYYVSWCVGHLIQSAMPEDYNPELKKWSMDTLPFIPERWQTVVSATTKNQYDVLDKLIKSSDVEELICATDAGREGELIFRLVYNKTGCKKPFKRLWISSMESAAIQNGFDTLKDGSEYENLYQSAVSRMNADFLVGINATRLFSCKYNKKLNIGRVQSPTINLIVKRQRAIESFVPTPYYNLIADCGTFKAYQRKETKVAADNAVKKCSGKQGTITSLDRKEKSENAAALFDLTTLQREANKLLGYSAQQTLDIAQSLYELKLTTYPRTDSRYLTHDMESSTMELIKALKQSKMLDTKTLKNYDTLKVNIQKIIDDSKVSDHHAIIPTKGILTADFEKLPTGERNILTLIMYRLLTAPYEAQRYTHTTLDLTVEGEVFTATGKQIISQGYKEFQNNLMEIIKATIEKDLEEKTDNEVISSNIKVGLKIPSVKVVSEAKKTKPLQPYTEDSLLGAMENAGKELEDQELKDAMKNSGLGTPATRAGIIERIITTGFVERKGKKLLATQQAYVLMDLLPDKLKEPELTAEWEQQLEMINKGEIKSSQFMQGIADYVTEIVRSAKGTVDEEDTKDIFKTEKESIGICPRCAKKVIEYPKSFSCESGKEGCGFVMWKEDKFFLDKKKQLTTKQAAELLKKGKVKMTGLYSAKKETKYDATIILVDTGKYTNYKLEF